MMHFVPELLPFQRSATDDDRFATDDDDGPTQEARRIRDEMLSAALPSGPSVVLRVGARATTAIRVEDRRLLGTRTVNHGPVILAASQATAAGASGGAAARVLRAAAQQAAERARLESLFGSPCPIVGSSGIARAVVRLGSDGGSLATLQQVHTATDRLGARWVEGRQSHPAASAIEPMLVGSAVLGAILEQLGVAEIVAGPESNAEQIVDLD